MILSTDWCVAVRASMKTQSKESSIDNFNALVLVVSFADHVNATIA